MKVGRGLPRWAWVWPLGRVQEEDEFYEKAVGAWEPRAMGLCVQWSSS